MIRKFATSYCLPGFLLPSRRVCLKLKYIKTLNILHILFERRSRVYQQIKWDMSHVIAFPHANIGWKVLCPAFSSTENKSIGKVHGRHQAPELWLFELEVCSVHMNVPIFSSPFLVLQDIRNIYISLKCRHLIANILKQLYSCLSCRNHPIVCMFILIDQIIGGSQIN